MAALFTPRAISGSTLRLAVLNDLHAQFAPSETMQAGYPGATPRAEWLLSQFHAGGELEKMDLAVCAGDLIHGENLASITVEMAALRARLGALPVPVYPCCGNHEISQQEGDPAYEAPYLAAFGAGSFDYSFMAGPCEIVVLNNAGTFHVTTARREARWEALGHLLKARPGVPKILVCHIPLVSMREPDVLRESFGFRSYQCLESELLDVLDEQGGDVKLVVSGHLHLTGKVVRRGVLHLVTSGTASFPHDFPVITITPDKLEVEVRTLPPALHEPRSNLHGPPRYAEGYVDAAHPDAWSYLRGHADERRFTVSLNAAHQ